MSERGPAPKAEHKAWMLQERPPDGTLVCTALPIKLEVKEGMTKEGIEQTIEAFSERVRALAEAHGLEMCESGPEALRALSSAAFGQQVVAEIRAERRARLN